MNTLRKPAFTYGIEEEPLAPRKTRGVVQTRKAGVELKINAQDLSSSIQSGATVDVALGENTFVVMKPISTVSPVDKLWWYQDGWNGHRAERLSRTVLRHAQRVWRLAEVHCPEDLPRVTATSDAHVAFSWSDYYPVKELQLTVRDERSFNCKWVLRGEIGKTSGQCLELQTVGEILDKYYQYSSDDRQQTS